MKPAGITALVFFTAILLAATSCRTAEKETGEEVTLRFRPAQGEAFETSIAFRSKAGMSGMNITRDFIVDYTILPEAVNDSFATVKFTYDNFYMKTENPISGTAEYKSDSPSVAKGLGAQEISGFYDELVGQSFTVDISKNGRVMEPEELNNDLQQGFGTFGISPDMRQYLETLITTFPDNPVGKGDSWSTAILENEELGMSIKTRYLVTKVTQNYVELEMDGEVIPLNTDTAGSALRISGELGGELTIDRHNGQTKAAEIIQTLQLEASREEQTVSGTAENKITISTK